MNIALVIALGGTLEQESDNSRGSLSQLVQLGQAVVPCLSWYS